jgi:hypothetical protein
MCAEDSDPMRLESKALQYQTKPERDTPMAAKKKAPAKKKAAAKKAPAKKKAAAKKAPAKKKAAAKKAPAKKK